MGYAVKDRADAIFCFIVILFHSIYIIHTSGRFLVLCRLG